MDNTTTKTLHFSLGNKFGDVLGTIAQEHLMMILQETSYFSNNYFSYFK